MVIVPEDVLQVLSAAVIDGPRLTLSGQIDRPLYVVTNKVLEAAGGKWNRAAKAHLFDGGAAEAIEPIILTGTYSRTKQDFGQFDSPPFVVDIVIEMADLRPGMTVLEPSAGIGNLVKAIRAKQALVHAIEVDQKRYSTLSNLILWGGGTGIAEQADFLKLRPSPDFDRVLMNPPFAPAQADIRHVMHALGFVKPGGKLVSVMSASVLFRSNALTVDFRNLIAQRGGAMVRLPEGAFRESGTMVNACVVSIPGVAE